MLRENLKNVSWQDNPILLGEGEAALESPRHLAPKACRRKQGKWDQYVAMQYLLINHQDVNFLIQK